MTTIYARERTLQEEIAPTVEERLPGVEVLAVELLSPSRFCVYVDAIRTGRELEGRKRFRGEVLAAGENAVTLAVSGAEPLDIRYDSIVRGNLIDEG